MPGFVKEDDAGQYVRCAEAIIEDDTLRFCGGKQRRHPTTDGVRRWVCPNCGAGTVQPAEEVSA